MKSYKLVFNGTPPRSTQFGRTDNRRNCPYWTRNSEANPPLCNSRFKQRPQDSIVRYSGWFWLLSFASWLCLVSLDYWFWRENICQTKTFHKVDDHSFNMISKKWSHFRMQPSYLDRIVDDLQLQDIFSKGFGSGFRSKAGWQAKNRRPKGHLSSWHVDLYIFCIFFRYWKPLTGCNRQPPGWDYISRFGNRPTL